MYLGREFVYRRAQAQLERGGRSWRVVKDMVRHGNGTVTNNVVKSGLSRPRALAVTRQLNRPNP